MFVVLACYLWLSRHTTYEICLSKHLSQEFSKYEQDGKIYFYSSHLCFHWLTSCIIHIRIVSIVDT